MLLLLWSAIIIDLAALSIHPAERQALPAQRNQGHHALRSWW
jgi:hypothetical protein